MKKLFILGKLSLLLIAGISAGCNNKTEMENTTHLREQVKNTGLRHLKSFIHNIIISNDLKLDTLYIVDSDSLVFINVE